MMSYTVSAMERVNAVIVFLLVTANQSKSTGLENLFLKTVVLNTSLDSTGHSTRSTCCYTDWRQ